MKSIRSINDPLQKAIIQYSMWLYSCTKYILRGIPRCSLELQGKDLLWWRFTGLSICLRSRSIDLPICNLHSYLRESWSNLWRSVFLVSGSVPSTCFDEIGPVVSTSKHQHLKCAFVQIGPGRNKRKSEDDSNTTRGTGSGQQKPWSCTEGNKG